MDKENVCLEEGNGEDTCLLILAVVEKKKILPKNPLRLALPHKCQNPHYLCVCVGGEGESKKTLSQKSYSLFK